MLNAITILQPEVQHVKVDQEFQAVWESGVSYMYKLAVEYLFLCDSFILKVVGRTTADGTTILVSYDWWR